MTFLWGFFFGIGVSVIAAAAILANISYQVRDDERAWQEQEAVTQASKARKDSKE